MKSCRLPCPRLSDCSISSILRCIIRYCRNSGFPGVIQLAEHMSDVNIIIRTADPAREAEVSLPGSKTGEDLVQAAVENWSLPEDTDYSMVNTRTAMPVQPDGSLDSQDIKDGDVLEIRLAIDTASLQKSSIKWTDKSQSKPPAEKVQRIIVTCPNCKAGLHLRAGSNNSVTCPFCQERVGTAT